MSEHEVLKLVEPSPEVQAFIEDLNDVFVRHDMDQMALLALVSQLLGKISAMQDPQTDPSTISMVISRNLEAGAQMHIVTAMSTDGLPN